ncbi:hypothetical protein B0T10DRAFT_591336 [Thelonectria olida]|uniref:3-beta hydroxysteroid dehydrogenase/isomerase domain-containing protein n=1 Tax=Thelonectria olida TaxID=1576542 RepID=A0A9P8VSB1_9HYPO|nr:hypothetical protein B0T10DRAFT_591336 [Thelonectria olida]
MHSKNTVATPLRGSCLVVGGCGFLGYHIVRHLLQDDQTGVVHVLDRQIEQNRHEKAAYTCGNITDSALLYSLVAEIRPSVIFHVASPLASLLAKREGEFFETNVRGTQALLTVAVESEFVQALVYTSSVDTYANPPHDYVNESHVLWASTDKSNEYNRTKAIAGVLVRQANGPQLRTVCLRLGHAYGERHVQGMVEVLDMCAGNKKLVQVGPGNNLMEVLSADNCATAHVLAAKALLEPSRAAGRVDGEAFNISDGKPMPFWHHIKLIWKTAREWLFWVFTLNMVKPPVQLRRVSLGHCLYTHTYSIEKARETLLFNPVSDHDAVLEQSARWMLRHRESMK